MQTDVFIHYTNTPFKEAQAFHAAYHIPTHPSSIKYILLLYP